MRVAVLALVLVLAGPAFALETGKYRYDVGGPIEAVRAFDANGDGRVDLVVLWTETDASGARRQGLTVLLTPATPAGPAFFGDGDARRIPLEGPLQAAGALSLGRFGPKGEPRLRFLAPDGVHDVAVLSGAPPTAGPAVPTLFARGPGRPLVFWDAAADLDGDGRDEGWFPAAEGNGATVVVGGAGVRTLSIESGNRAETTAEHALVRRVFVPVLEAADLDGDGRKELLAHEEDHLVVWGGAGAGDGAPEAPLFRLPLGLARTDLGPDDIHTPRLQVADADRDGKADLLVTLVTGRRDQVSTLRTRLLHFPGPFRDGATGRLVPPRVRIDTESIALHPRFLDLDGDGDLDYLGDSIRGTEADLLRRVLGQAPTIWHVAFRFDRAKGTFEEVPWFSVERPYSRDEALSNRFGTSGHFGGDFDGDRLNDLLDLGDLGGLEILGAVARASAGPGDPVSFVAPLVPRTKTPEPLAADAIVRDLDGDGRSDAVLRSGSTLYLVVPRSGP
jgi:hypothetical protein